MAYYSLEPFGDSRADLRTGIVASLIANIHRGKDQKPYKPEDFMPRIAEPEDEAERDRNLFAKIRARFGIFDAALKAKHGNP
jgi:hypothetical protein